MDFACLFWQKNPLYLLLIFCLGDFSCCSKGPNNLPVNSEYNQIHWYTIGLQKVFTQKGKFHFMSSSPLPLPQLAHYHFEGSGYLVLTGISFYFHSDHLGSLPPPPLFWDMSRVTGSRRLQDHLQSATHLEHLQWEASCQVTKSHFRFSTVSMLATGTWRPVKNLTEDSDGFLGR